MCGLGTAALCAKAAPATAPPAPTSASSTFLRVDKAALAEAHAKELLLLMDVDKTGKISKQEWMKFMEEEFDRLDKDKKGELDQKELMQARVWIKQKPFQRLGK